MLRLKEIREKKGMTQLDIANIVGITQQAYANYENGKREPDYETLKKIAEYFDCSIDYLLGRTDMAVEAYQEGFERRRLKEQGKVELLIGLSKDDKEVLTNEDRAEITKFAEFVANKRKENK